MVIDPLEPYRKMARSIRFVPPLALANRPQKQAERPEPIIHAPQPQDCGWSQSLPLFQEAAIDPVPDSSEQIAISQPAVLIQENVGDRISCLEDSSNQGFVSASPEVMPKATLVEQTAAEEQIQPIEAAPTLPAKIVSEIEPIAEVEPIEPDAIPQTVTQLEAMQFVIQPPLVEARSPAVELPVKSVAKASAIPKTASSKAAKSKAASKKKAKGFGAKTK